MTIPQGRLLPVFACGVRRNAVIIANSPARCSQSPQRRRSQFPLYAPARGGVVAYGAPAPAALVSAANQWWGHASGPGGAGPGSGDAISSGVYFTPWATEPFLEFPIYRNFLPR